jgi:hypothetical protein
LKILHPLLLGLALPLLSPGAASAVERWVGCAEEGATCRFDGVRRVAYGTGQKWSYRQFDGAAPCTSGAFGGDPAPNQRKRCRYLAAPDPIGYLPVPPHWVPCARTGEVCRIDGKRKVAYGTGNTWVAETFVSSFECSDGIFGDPAPGKAKECRVLMSATGGMATPVPAPPAASGKPHWVGCAVEGKRCGFEGRRRVAFGKGDRWNTGVFTNGVACTREHFGDPAPNVVKECRVDLASRP